ncbi:MAG: hypothetical protein QNL98_15240, partial [Mycobacterium sp.]
MRDLIIALPLWLIVAVLLVFFCGVIFTARWLISRRCGEDAREELVDQAKSLLTGLAATFAFFVGFAITVTWGAVSAGQVAVEQQAASIQQMAWKLNSITNQGESTALMDKLRTYALTAATEDDPYLIRGDTTNLPSTIPLDHFEDALHTYAFGPTAAPQEVNSLVTAAATVGTNSATVSAVAQRSLPGVLTTLLLTSGVLVAVVMGIMTVTSRRPAL